MEENRKITEDQADKVSGGIFNTTGSVPNIKCSCCGRSTTYAASRPWGTERIENADFYKGFICDECIKDFNDGKIKDKKFLDMFDQLK